MAKARHTVKMEAIELYANGASMNSIADKLGVNFKTVYAWKSKSDPLDWDAYRQAADAKKMEKAIDQMGKKAGQVVSEQLDKSILLSRTAGALLTKLAKSIAEGQRDLSEATVNILHRLEKTLSGVQRQQAQIFDLPTHRISMSPRDTPRLSDKELNSMSEQELITMIDGLDKGEKVGG